MNKTELISVIIPTFNRAKRVMKAVESVIAQTYPRTEIIVVDDGSEDDTGEMVLAEFPEVTLIRTENKGVSAARNAGITMSKGALLAFLDSDDYWLPKKLERQAAYMQEHPELKISQTEEIWIRRGRHVNPKKRHAKEGGWIFERSLELCLVSPSTVMMWRGLLDEVGLFDETMPVCEDYDLWLRIAWRYPIGLLDEPLIIKHAGHADQLSWRRGLDKWRIYALEKLLAEADLSAAQRKAAIRQFKRKCRIYANGCKKRGKLEEAEEYFEKARSI